MSKYSQWGVYCNPLIAKHFDIDIRELGKQYCEHLANAADKLFDTELENKYLDEYSYNCQLLVRTLEHLMEEAFVIAKKVWEDPNLSLIARSVRIHTLGSTYSAIVHDLLESLGEEVTGLSRVVVHRNTQLMKYSGMTLRDTTAWLRRDSNNLFSTFESVTKNLYAEKGLEALISLMETPEDAQLPYKLFLLGSFTQGLAVQLLLSTQVNLVEIPVSPIKGEA